MPKIRQNRFIYKAKEISAWVCMQMKLHDLDQTDLGEVLGISQQKVSYKLRNCTFTLCDFQRLIEYFKPTDDEILKLMKV